MRTAEELREDFRAAVASGEYARAGCLWTDCCRRWQGGLGEAASAGELEDLRRLLEWTRGAVTAARAVALEELNQLEVRRRYLAPSPRSSHLVQISG